MSAGRLLNKSRTRQNNEFAGMVFNPLASEPHSHPVPRTAIPSHSCRAVICARALACLHVKYISVSLKPFALQCINIHFYRHEFAFQSKTLIDFFFSVSVFLFRDMKSIYYNMNISNILLAFYRSI